MGIRKKTKNQTIRRPKLRLQTQFGGKSHTNQVPDPVSVDRKQLIWQAVASIPRGKVASYGQIAKLIGYPNHARYVGSTLRNLPKDTRLPWFRVVNGSMRISLRGGGEARQKRRLLAEDITFVGERIAHIHRWETGDE